MTRDQKPRNAGRRELDPPSLGAGRKRLLLLCIVWQVSYISWHIVYTSRNIRTLHFGSKAQDQRGGVPETVAGRILMLMWSLRPLEAAVR